MSELEVINCVTPVKIAREGQILQATLAISQGDFNAYNSIHSCFLHNKEVKQVEQYPAEKRKHSYLAGRYAAKQAILALNPKVDVKDILIEPGIFEFPLVREPSEALTTSISISHTNSLGVALAYPDIHPMGLDIELVQADKARVIKSQMTDKDLELLPTLASGNEILGLTMLWAAKEALSKAIKCGMMVSFKVLEVSTYQTDKSVEYCEFTHFSQYKVAFIKNEFLVIAIALPRKSYIQNYEALQQCLLKVHS